MPVTIDGTTGITTPAISSTTPAGVASGGTGATTLTANNVVLGNGTSAVQFVAPGTNGNVLTSNGTTWASSTPAAAGSLILLSTISASASSTVDVETGFSSTYDNYVIYANNLYTTSGASSQLRCLYKMNGVYVNDATYFSTVNFTTIGATTYAALGYQNVAYINLSPTTAVPASISRALNFEFLVFGVNNASTFKYSLTNSAELSGFSNTSGIGTYAGGAGALSGIRFFLAAGTITGTFYLYGIKKS